MASLYTALPPGYFRLLRILDNTGLKCSVEIYSLDEPPRYYALSYVWREVQYEGGDSPTQPYEIEVNGQVIQTQKNLYDALQYLGPEIWEAGHKVWIDFLCINQNDLAERSEQVQFMGMIYEDAIEVLAWLGLPFKDGRTGQGIALMRDLDHYMELNYDIDDFLRHISINKPYFPVTSNAELVAGWQAIGELFSRKYWTRTWIYQEATASRVRFCCGHHRFDVYELSAVCFFTSSYYAEPEFVEVQKSCLPAILLWKARNAKRKVNLSTSSNLVPLLAELRTTLCSDPRDKVYATISRAIDATPDRFTVDYTKSLSEVYIAVVQFALSFSHGLEILGYVVRPSADMLRLPHVYEPLIPSWMPDWRTVTGHRPFNSSLGNFDPHQVLYDACPDTVVDASIAGLELHMRGFLLDSIVILPTNVDLRDNGICSLQNYNSTLRARGARFADESFDRAVIGDANFYFDEQVGPAIQKRGASVDWSLLNASPTSLDRDAHYRREDLVMRIDRLYLARRMGYTKEGRLGIFPRVAEESDFIAAFHGGRTLYVVRPVVGEEEKYTFIGECYVDEMMDGQAMELAAERNIKARVLTLV